MSDPLQTIGAAEMKGQQLVGGYLRDEGGGEGDHHLPCDFVDALREFRSLEDRVASFVEGDSNGYYLRGGRDGERERECLIEREREWLVDCKR